MYEIATITFATHNLIVIKMLMEKGELITEGKFVKIKEFDKKIQRYIENHADLLKRPARAYVTFERQEGYEAASKITGGYNIFG